MRYYLAALPFVVILMLVGLITGVLRLMNLHGIAYDALFTKLFLHHGEIMTFGFLAPVIMIERYSGSLVLFPPRAVHAIPLFATLGALLKFAGFTTAQDALNVLGSAVLSVGILAYLYLLLFLSKRAASATAFKFMGLAAVTLLISAFATLAVKPVLNLPLVLLMFSFPVLTILGERMDMAKFVPKEIQRRAEYGFALALLSSLLLLAAFAAQSKYALFAAVLLYAAVAAPIFQMDMTATRGAKGGMQGYLARHTLIAYLWLFLGLLLLLLISLRGFSTTLYDAATHSVAVGFVGTMILAHGPIILPSMLGLRLAEEKVSLIPLAFLTLANVLRVGGEVLLGVSPLAGFSSFLVLLSLLSFAAMVALAMRR